jgi:hypothetical protein
MTISYEIILTVLDLTTNITSTFIKTFDFDLSEIPEEKIYNNYHKIADKVKMFTLFKDEINDFCDNNGLTINNIDIDEFNINSNTDRVDVYFEPGDGDDPNQISLEPNILCYVYPKYDELKAPVLKGVVYDSNTIIWSWDGDDNAHYLVSEGIDIEDEESKDKIIAQVPIGTNRYVETGLEPNTSYTRRLIAYNSEQTSLPCNAVTVQTATAPIDISLEQYEVPKNYDYTSDDSLKEVINENLEAFHSGVGDKNDLKVYKQMDGDFYQKFKTYIQLKGERIEREKRYNTVGFNYKVCLESTETVEEQKGEVTFSIDVYPIEKISIKDYMFTTHPVTVKAYAECDVLLKKPMSSSDNVECVIQEPEWEKDTVRVENKLRQKNEKGPAYSGILDLVIAIDISGSMILKSGGHTRWYYTKKAIIKSINTIKKEIKKAMGGEDNKMQLRYYITLFAGSAKCKRIAKGKHSAISNVKTVLNSIDVTNCQCTSKLFEFKASDLTNHYAGLTAHTKIRGLKKPNSKQQIILFFTDGFANKQGSTIVVGTDSPAKKQNKILNGITHAYEKALEHNSSAYICTLFGAGKNDWDISVKIRPTRPVEKIIAWDKKVREKHKKIAKKTKRVFFTSVSYSDYSTKLAGAMKKICKTALEEFKNKHPDKITYYYEDIITGDHLPYDKNDPEKNRWKTVDRGWNFKGWKDSSTTISLPVNYNIDDMVWAHVRIYDTDGNYFKFTLNDSITPVVYDTEEGRAIIPSSSYIRDVNFDDSAVIRQGAIKLSNSSLQSLILEAVRSTTEYLSGYNEIVTATSAEDLLKGQYIIRNLFVYDNFSYDSSEVGTYSTSDKWENGYSGTLNVYANINKMNTMSLGDDIYSVKDDSYLWLSGYTDAIIYDGERAVTTELNASHAESSDKQEAYLLDTYADYTNLLWNRNNRKLSCPSSERNNIRHVIEIIDKDKHVYITGSDDSLTKVGDWAMFVPNNITITNDLITGTTYPVIKHYSDNNIIAHNDERHQSPVLNYRFNLEDKDAYTSYYELLPTCDRESTYQNIVFVNIYYANNIYIQNEEKVGGTDTLYIESFGASNIATKASPTFRRQLGQNYFRDEYIDDYVWFQAKPMVEVRDYYDEIPAPGMDTLYGKVNGRYSENNKNGKKDLRVVTPKFNIPTTIDPSDINIYIMITEFNPEDALVAYKWENPSSLKNDITNTNGDYVTFSSDSLTYKDVQYIDLIKTVNTEPIELFDNKTTLKYFNIEKPILSEEYRKYYIDLVTDNSDVMVINYPNEIKFDEENKAEFGANFKGVVNATTKWSPRIHNGYYYINQHEYYAYSEFDVEADFEELTEENCKIINGFLTIDVELLRKAGDPEHYDLLKDTRSSLMQDETKFTWIKDKGLTMLPVINGEYYKEYGSYTYISPVILFPNVLTSAGMLNVEYEYDDGSTDWFMEVRSYNIAEGKWSKWYNFSNNQIPTCPLSCGYQVRFTFMASVTNHDKTIEDYLCCYLDWKEDGVEEAFNNCIIVTDHIQAGPYKSDGTYVSKLIDFGCVTSIKLDLFQSNINKSCTLYVATDLNNEKNLSLDNIKWTAVTCDPDNPTEIQTRFFRYKIVVPYGEKVYWLHKNIITQESDVVLPYLKSISMSGDYVPVDTKDAFQEIQSFDIITDGKSHKVFNSIYNIISTDVVAKGFTDNEIYKVRVKSTEGNISLEYNSNVNRDNPTVEALNTPIYATADFETEINVKNSPYIYSSMDPVKEMDVLEITKGTPQQYCPITMEDIDGTSYIEVFDVDPNTLQKTETYTIQTEDDRHFIALDRNDFDLKTFKVYLNEELYDNYTLKNNIIVFNKYLSINDTIRVTYNILNSFYTEIDYVNDKTQMTIYSDYDSEEAKKREIDNLKPILDTKTYRECKLSNIYSNGIKNVVYKNKMIPDPNWKYDAGLNALYYSQNIDNFSMIINNMIPLTSYEMTIVTYSESKDDDIVGVVIGYIKDSSNTTHTISYLVSLGNDYLFDGNNTAIVLDYGLTVSRILDSKTIEHEEFANWSNMPNGIKFYIKKNSSEIQCKISNWNNPDEWNNDSVFTLDLSSSEDLEIFKDPTFYGFCVQSQENVYFTAPEFAGRIDRTITVEEQMNKLKHKYKVYFETNKTNNKFIASDLSLNPIYRTDYKGFIYITDEHNEPYKINIYRNPKYIKSGGYDKMDVSIECLDYNGNPVISKNIDIDCVYGTIIYDNEEESEHLTDMNGVVHIIYESALSHCIDYLTARTVNSDNETIASSVEIINE